MFKIKATITCYLLPEDGPAAKAEFLNHLMNPGETWIIAYAFTLPAMVQDLLAAYRKGVPLHLYLDYSQDSDASEKLLVQELVDAGVEVTLGTSPAGSQYICHAKGIVSGAHSGGSAWCWEGSTNFTSMAWEQVNTALVFSSTEWLDQFVAQFLALRKYAWTNERSMQLMKTDPC